MSGSSIFTFLQKAVGHFNSLLFFICLLMKTRSKAAVVEARLNVSMMATLLCMQDFWKSFSGQTTAAHCTSNYCPAKVTEGYSKRLVVSCIQIHIGETALYFFSFHGEPYPDKQQRHSYSAKQECVILQNTYWECCCCCCCRQSRSLPALRITTWL